MYAKFNPLNDLKILTPDYGKRSLSQQANVQTPAIQALYYDMRDSLLAGSINGIARTDLVSAPSNRATNR